jgi:hypothetical protein
MQAPNYIRQNARGEVGSVEVLVARKSENYAGCLLIYARKYVCKGVPD